MTMPPPTPNRAQMSPASAPLTNSTAPRAGSKRSPSADRAITTQVGGQSFVYVREEYADLKRTIVGGFENVFQLYRGVTERDGGQPHAGGDVAEAEPGQLVAEWQHGLVAGT